MDEIHVKVYGGVQGVGFRWAVERLAKQHQLTGTVRNSEDGSVEIYAQGKNLEAFLDDLEHNSGPWEVDRVESRIYPAQKRFEDFRIIF